MCVVLIINPTTGSVPTYLLSASLTTQVGHCLIGRLAHDRWLSRESLRQYLTNVPLSSHYSLSFLLFSFLVSEVLHIHFHAFHYLYYSLIEWAPNVYVFNYYYYSLNNGEMFFFYETVCGESSSPHNGTQDTNCGSN